MVDDRRPANPWDFLPDPIRQLAKYGNFFGIAINKKPALPAAWKEHKDKLMSWNDALGKRDTLIANGKNALIYYVVAYTPVRPLDFDPDKITGQLRDKQIKAIEYYRDIVKAPIAISNSGVGRHIYIIDEDNQLPDIGSSYVESGKSVCEVKHGIIFITDQWEQRCPIPKVDQKSIDYFRAIKLDNVAPRQAMTTAKPSGKKIRKTKKALADLRDAIQWATNNNITNVIHNNSTFSCFALGAKQIGLPIEEQIAFCHSQDGDKTGIEQRLASTNDKDSDQRASCLSLFRKLGWDNDKNNEPPEGTTPISPELGKANGFRKALEVCGIEVRDNELIGIEVKLPDKDWQELNDSLFHQIAINYVAKLCVRKSYNGFVPFETDDATKRAVLLLLATEKPSVNSTREWLNTIPAKKDPEAIDVWLSCYKIDAYGRLADAGYEKKRIKIYHHHGVVLMMAGWIMRTLTPGCVYDKFVVLVGEPACGKGLGMMLQMKPKHVCPITGKITPNDAFKDKCRLSDDRSAWYHNRRCSFGESTELVGFSKPGNEKLKAIISATHDHQELKFQNYSMSMPKHYAITGTTNDRWFKPADSEGDRRIYILDLGYGSPLGKVGTRSLIPSILTDEWRRRAIGHVKWLIEKEGYVGDICDWDSYTEEIRCFMVGQSSKQYPRIEAALLAIANGTTDYLDEHRSQQGTSYSVKKEWAHYNYDKLIEDNDKTAQSSQIMTKGLPFNPTRYREDMPTWLRLLTLHDKTMVDKYGADKIKFVATEHLGWTFDKGVRRDDHGRVIRGWLIPRPL